MRRSRSSALPLAVALGGCGLLHTDPPARCPTDRTMVIASQADVTAFATCTTARGLEIRTGATVDVSPMRALEVIRGDLVIGPTVGVEAVSLSGLRQVDGAILAASNGSMRGLFLPRLERAGRISIEGNVSLASIALPRLATVTAGVTIADDHDLEVLDVQALTRVGGDLVIENAPNLSIVESGALAAVAAVRLDRVPKLPPATVDALRAAAGAGGGSGNL